MSRLATPLARELGARTAKALEESHDVRTTGELLRLYPRRYTTWGELTPLAALTVGDQATVVAEVVSSKARQVHPRGGTRKTLHLFEAVLTDGSSRISATFFLSHGGQAAFHAARLAPGRRAMFSGKVDSFRGGLQLAHPQYEPVGEDADDEELRARADQPIPIYPATAKVPSWKVGQAVGVLLDTLTADDVPDPVPAHLRELHRLPSLLDALLLAHRPTDLEQPRRARARFRYEEALVLQAALARRRAALSVLPASSYPRRGGGLLDAFDARLPFALTEGQREVGEAVAADLARTTPMNRLLQGEVGSGKTVVALRAMLQVVDAGAQAALLAPTEVLAAQHARSLTRMLGDLARGGQLGGAEGGTRVALLSGSLPAAARRAALLDITSGAAGIVVGTHALIQEAVDFHDLGLAVVDEQHRFGVEQRDALRAKSGTPPHVLVMTATPIPRTVAMTVFGDLETSVLAELPPGRSPIRSQVVPEWRPAWLDRTWQRVREEVDAGRQAYVVCPRIGTEEEALAALAAGGPGQDAGIGAPPPADDALFAGPAAGGVDGDQEEAGRGRSALEVLARLREEPATRDLRLGLLHGRLPAEEKDAVMTAFAAGEVDVLVATTVVEVGVDVPNATVMVVQDADRFGLSQLHQLRGRVGRGGHPGLCLFVVSTRDQARLERLEQVAATTDGFAVAELDLETRREGDVLGAAQSGHRSSLRLLRVTRDADVIATARADAAELVAVDPHLELFEALGAELAALDAEREAYLDRG